MKVTLINYTLDAEALLLFTKSTRLELSPSLFQAIKTYDAYVIRDELEYMANTIPSSWEFIHYTFLVEGVSRAYTHQQVRTRAASYAQQSMRITNQSNFDFVMPDKITKNLKAQHIVNALITQIKNSYMSLIKCGIPPEDARCILPTNIATNIVCCFNLRTFTDLVKSRSGGRTQNEYRQVVKAMADEVLKVHPWAELFLYPKGMDYFDAIEAFAEKYHGNDLKAKGELLKIIDKMRK